MDFKVFNNLELIPHLLIKIEELNNKIELFSPKLNTKKGVMQFLDKSDKTIHNYINDGRFIENIHFYRKNGKMIFVESAIIDFKKSYLNKSGNFAIQNAKIQRLRNEIL